MKEMLMLAPVAAHKAEFKIPDGVERIAAECFNVIEGIETISIPASVKEISEGAIFSTFDLKEIKVAEDNQNYKSENGLLLSEDGKLLLAWPDGTQAGELVIPDGVERIGAYLFYGRTDKAYTVVLPEGVKEIGILSLPYDIKLLKLPASLEKIENSVFYDGMVVDTIEYGGKEEDWKKIKIGEDNTALDSAYLLQSDEK